MGQAIFAKDALEFSTRDGLFAVSGLSEQDIYFTPHAFLQTLEKAQRVYGQWAAQKCSVLLPMCKGCERIGEQEDGPGH